MKTLRINTEEKLSKYKFKIYLTHPSSHPAPQQITAIQVNRVG